MKIGFIGLGRMGFPMAKNLLTHHQQLMVFDVSTEPMNLLEKEGATVAKTIEDLASACEIIITMLPNTNDVKTVYEQKIFSHAHPNTILIDCSSIDVDVARALHEQANKKHFVMLDAPVSGGAVGAANASLTFMVGGQASAFEKIKPILALMGKNMIHAGASGNGQAAKICNNMILGISMIAVSEAFILAEKLGLDPKTFFDISSKSSGQCWSMLVNCPYPHILETAPSNNGYKPGFPSQLMLKDLTLSQNAATHVHAHTPLGAKAREIYEKWVDAGHGMQDFSSVLQLFQQE